jgi:putative phosphoesterase
MKYVIASDIHGSADWCKKLLQAFANEGADKLVLLGDLLYHGPRNDLPDGYCPKQVFAMLNTVKEKIICVRGNCDSEVDQMVLDFPCLADYAILDGGDRTLFATHGHLYNKTCPPLLGKNDVLLNGHFHKPECVKMENGYYLNCGSVSLPFDGTPHAYLVYENGLCMWKNAENEKPFKTETL